MLPRLLLLGLGLAALPGYVQLRVDAEDPQSPHLRFSQGFAVPIHVHSSGYADIAFADLRAALEAALGTWHVDGSTLRFVRDDVGPDGDTPVMDGVSEIRFETRALPPEVDPDTVLAFTSHVSATCTGVLLEADVTFNAVTVRWSTSLRSQRADVQTVAVHEFGHLLGLDHTDLRDAVMFPSIVDRVRRGLHADDLAGVRAIYRANRGSACQRDADCAGGEVCLLTLLSDASVGSVCGPALGAGRGGARCAAEANACDNGCANGLCGGDSTCSVLCRVDADCGAGLCLAQDIGDGQLVPFCIDVTLCDDDLQGCPRGQACLPAAHPTEDRVLRLCGDAGADPLGAACAAHEQCAGGLCLDGRCTALCDRDSDCGGVFECVPRSVLLDVGREETVSLCALAEIDCVRPSDCPAPLQCAFTLVDGDVTARCLEGGGSPAGAPCGRHDTCRSKLCLSAERVCTDSCREDADCPDGMVCGRETVQGQAVPACTPEDAAPSDAEPLPPPSFDAGAPAADGAPAGSRDGAAPIPDATEARPPDATPGGPPLSADAGAPPSTPGVVVTRGNGGGCLQDVSGGAPGPASALLTMAMLLLWTGARRRR